MGTFIRVCMCTVLPAGKDCISRQAEAPPASACSAGPFVCLFFNPYGECPRQCSDSLPQFRYLTGGVPAPASVPKTI